MGKPDISVVIVSYKVWDYLKPCIKSVHVQQGVTLEVIVIDNNSRDNTVSNIRKEFSEVKLIANTDNKGFSGANNQGISSASGDYILLLNPDTELKEPDTLFKLKRSLDNMNPRGIIAPALLNTDSSYQPSYWPIPGIKELFLEIFHLYKQGNKSKPQQPLFIEAASGAALFFNKELIDKIGLLDEDMFWMEDMDFCYRAKKAGRRILYDPSINIVHHGGKSSDDYSVVIPNQVMSKLKFYKKHGSWLEYIIMDKLSFWFITTRLFAFATLSLGRNDVFIRKRKAYSIAMRRYLKFNFAGDDVIISKV